MQLVSDIQKLREASSDVQSVEEAEIIIEQLKTALDKFDNGVGLAAIQIGIPKRVGVIKNDKKDKYQDPYIILINSKLKECQEEIIYCREGCLSFPTVFIDTKRYKHYVIQNHCIREGKLEEQTEYYYFSNDTSEPGNDGILAIAVQHELDHFEGINIFDRQQNIISSIQRRVVNKVGRNDPCPCGSGKKYKKCCLGKEANLAQEIHKPLE